MLDALIDKVTPHSHDWHELHDPQPVRLPRKEFQQSGDQLMAAFAYCPECDTIELKRCSGRWWSYEARFVDWLFRDNARDISHRLTELHATEDNDD